VPGTEPPAGIREKTPAVVALVHARAVVRPGRVLDDAVIVLRDGVIEAVGTNLRLPPDAAVVDLAGKTVYPGFLDAYAEFAGAAPRGASPPGAATEAPGGPAAPAAARPAGARYWNDQIVPEFRADEGFRADSAGFAKRRSQGFAAALAAPTQGLLKGTSALVLLGDGEAARLVLVPEVALHATFFVTPRWPVREYPTSPMGAYTLLRQAFYDAEWYGRAHAAWLSNRSLPRPETNLSLAALEAHLRARRPVVIDTRDELYALRADRLSREFGFPLLLRGSGNEYRRLAEIQATGRAFLLPVNFPKAPPVGTPEEAIDVTLEELLHWDHAPENPARLVAAGVPVALTTDGLEDPAKFLERLRTAVQRGLPPDAALEAITLVPARLLGAEAKLGSLEPGKLANFAVTDGDLFAAETVVQETWVEGRRYPVAARQVVDPRGTWEVRAGGEGAPPLTQLVIEGKPGKLSGKATLGGEERKLKSVEMLEDQLLVQAPVDTGATAPLLLASGTVASARITGHGMDERGASFRWSATRTAAHVEKAAARPAKEPEAASFPVNYPLGMYGRTAAPEQPEVVAFRGGVIWTCGPPGRIEDGTVLVRRGRIAAVGRGVAIPRGAQVVELHGRHVTPGLIDAHSHMATDGGVNEAGQTISAEVRIGDFVDCDDMTIYRQLAGGLTAAHVMHGSANTIGGQCQVVKLRWGASPEEMKFAAAPPTIKFALGENVKQANWGDRFTTRYPQTRMGVEQLVRDAFRTAREYEAAWAAWSKGKRGIPPRRDLELDALVEVVNNRRLIHCHSYRQDEILALMQVCDDFGVKLGVFQHILEGYKVADEMAERNIGGSSFSDWWAYKVEVIDAIPYNGALMDRVGVVVSFNSDSDEMGRRMNTEAAKAVRYGGLSEERALGFVTVNAAKQLRIDHRVGSLEVGKDADLAVWSGSPLSTLSRCEETWVDGRRYFSLEEARAQLAEGRRMHAALVQKALRSEDAGKGEIARTDGRMRPGYSCTLGSEEGEE
jgi:N-acetylglucosamine-6-phosphate deacetylase